jgi:peptide/nickel transport system ATP-binding protein
MVATDKIEESNSNEAAAEVIQNDGAPLLRIDDLHVWYELKRWGFGHAGFVRAVDGVSFDLKRGDAIACVGESGCGKSSLMKTILGLNRPTKGDVIFDDIRLSNTKGGELRLYRAKVGYVQQDPFGALPPFMSVQSILEEPMIINRISDREERQRRIDKTLEEVKLTPVEEILPKFPHMLSGGQQQRVVIARAMIMDPKLLVADEPVSMLDASVRVEILRLLRKLQADRNLAVIYITHDLATVRYFSEYIFVMYAGEIVEFARMEELLHDPKHPYTLALLEASSDPDADNALVLREVPKGEPPSLVSPPKGCRFNPRCAQMIAGLCDLKSPPDLMVGSEHRVACWLFDEEAS